MVHAPHRGGKSSVDAPALCNFPLTRSKPGGSRRSLTLSASRPHAPLKLDLDLDLGGHALVVGGRGHAALQPCHHWRVRGACQYHGRGQYQQFPSPTNFPYKMNKSTDRPTRGRTSRICAARTGPTGREYVSSCRAQLSRLSQLCDHTENDTLRPACDPPPPSPPPGALPTDDHKMSAAALSRPTTTTAAAGACMAMALSLALDNGLPSTRDAVVLAAVSKAARDSVARNLRTVRGVYQRTAQPKHRPSGRADDVQPAASTGAGAGACCGTAS